MIQRSEIASIGTILKTHGLHGEVAVALDGPRAAGAAEGLQHVVLCIDGIYVPFRIASVRTRGTCGLLMCLDGIESADEAAAYTGLELFAPLREMPADSDSDSSDEGDGLYAEDLEGFDVLDPEGQRVGRIDSVDTTTINTLLHISLAEGGRTALVPLADDWIVALDPESRTISLDIPEQLLTGNF